MPISGLATNVSTGAATGGVIGAAAGFVVSVFKSSAAGPNRDAAAQVYAEVVKENLAAVAAFIQRARLQTSTSADPWKAGLATISPGLQAAARVKFPAVDTDWALFGGIPPEAVYPKVMQLAAFPTGNTDTTVNASAPAGPLSTDKIQTGPPQTIAGMPAWLMIGLIAGGVYAVVQAQKKAA